MALLQETNIAYGEVSGHPLYLDILSAERPADGSLLRPVVWVHGGGWVGGERWWCPNETMATAGFFTVTIQYRYGPEASHPAQIHDVKAAIRWVRANAERYGVDGSRVGIWGHSAGGHLSALAACTNGKPEFEGHSGNPGWDSSVQCAVPMSPPLELLQDWYAISGYPQHPEALFDLGNLLGCMPWDDRMKAAHASPYWQADANAVPQLVIHGDNDDLVPIPQAYAYMTWLERQGQTQSWLITVPGGDHNITGPLFPDQPDPQDLRGQVIAFFREHLGN